MKDSSGTKNSPSQTYNLSITLLILLLGASVQEPAQVKSFRGEASSLIETGRLSQDPGFQLLSAYDSAGRPHGYIDGWRERKKVYRALAEAAALRGLENLAASLAEKGRWGLESLPRASDPLPEQGHIISPGALQELLIAWPFVESQYQGKTLIGMPWSRLRPEAGDAIMGRGFIRVQPDPKTGIVSLDRLINPWGEQEGLGSFSIYVPAATKFTLSSQGRGDTKFFLNNRWRKSGVWTPLARGWSTILLRFKPPSPGPLEPGDPWVVSLEWEQETQGFLWTGSPKPSWDELTGYLAWVAGRKVLGPPKSQTRTVSSQGSTQEAKKSSADMLAQILLSKPNMTFASSLLDGKGVWGSKVKTALAFAWSSRPGKAAAHMEKILKSGEAPLEVKALLHNLISRWAREPKPDKRFSISKIEAMIREGQTENVLKALPWWPGAHVMAGEVAERKGNLKEAGRLYFEASEGLIETSLGEHYWSKGLYAQGMHRPVQVRGTRTDYSELHDGWLSTFQEFSKGSKSVVLDLGVVTRVRRLILMLGKGAGIEDLVVEGSRDGGFYGLLGEFKGQQAGVLDLPLDPGMKVRTLRLKFVVPEEPEPLRIKECLVGY